MKWISVEDRLPETCEYVFTCVKMNGIPQCVGFHYFKDGKWWEGFEEDSVGAVEYWLPIPRFGMTKDKKDNMIKEQLLDFLDQLIHLGIHIDLDQWSKSECAEWIAWVMERD